MWDFILNARIPWISKNGNKKKGEKVNSFWIKRKGDSFLIKRLVGSGLCFLTRIFKEKNRDSLLLLEDIFDLILGFFKRVSFFQTKSNILLFPLKKHWILSNLWKNDPHMAKDKGGGERREDVGSPWKEDLSLYKEENWSHCY